MAINVQSINGPHKSPKKYNLNYKLWDNEKSKPLFKTYIL